MFGRRFFIPLLASLLATTIAEEDVTTITETNYITPQWFMDIINTALEDNPKSQDSGIEVVFVNGELAGQDAPGAAGSGNAAGLATYVTSSEMAYLMQSNGVVYTSTAPITYTTTGSVTSKSGAAVAQQTGAGAAATTTATTAGRAAATSRGRQGAATTGTATNNADRTAKAATDSDSPRQRSTIYEYETETDNSNVFLQLTRSAKTTTKTVFSATTTPSTIYKGSTVYQPITRTISDPVTTASVVTKTRSKKISFDESSLSEGVTLTDAAKAVASDSASAYSSDFEVSEDSSVGPSTIDLRISSYTSSVPNTRVAKYYNSSDASASSYETSSGASLESSAASSASSSAVSSASASITASIISSASSDVSSSEAASSTAASSHSPLARVAASQNLFEAVSRRTPQSVFPRKALPLSIPSGVDNGDTPYQTNKFYVNLFLGDQTDMIWSYPYGLQFKKNDYYGLGMQHTNVSDRIFGPTSKVDKGKTYFFNPVGVSDLIFSATSLTKNNIHMGVTDMKSMSAKVTFSTSQTVGSDYVEMPIVQGMGFVTAIYHGSMTAELNTLVGIKTVKKETSDALASNVLKYRVTLFNGVQFLVYAIVPKGTSTSGFSLNVKDSFHVQGSKAIDNLIIQAAVAPNSKYDGYYDEAAGKYPVSASVSGSSSGTSAQYAFNYKTKGTSSSGKTMVFALPHHVESFTSETSKNKTPIKLASTTKGDMVGVLANELKLSETINTNVQFLPWAPIMTKDLSYTSAQLKLMAKTAQSELDVDIKETVAGMNSNYYSGKVIDKYANILLVVHDIIGDKTFAKEILADMKKAFKVFTENKQYYPLMYDTKFKGLTSSASQDGDTGADFGSAYYNDHHFHYGYFIHAAAVVGYIDQQLGGSWTADNKGWVNNLVRDVANPTEADTAYPVSRMFDWFAGHSWAGGLFSAGDGRNEESSSEDYHFAYGMKLWGSVIGDSSMEGRGNLMLSIMNRAMNKYFYFSDDNNVVPKEMIPNKVSGIFFDNKIAFTTYFGDSDEYPQYVHGIHMLPMTAATALIRGTTYVKQEWKQTIESFIGKLTDGWAGILRLNQALFDPKSSYNFFSSSSFKNTYLDNGQSRTWSLAFSGGLLNAST